MKRSTQLLMGTWLTLQIIVMAVSHPSQALVREADDTTQVPLYSLHHARELLGDKEFSQMQQEHFLSREYARFIHRRTRELLPQAWRSQARLIASSLIEAGNRHQMDPLFLVAVARQESRFNPKALGRHGEVGLMQIKPSTARWLLSKKEKDPSKIPSEEQLREMLKDPAVNIRFGADYLAYLRKSFHQSSHLYLSAYNMGEANVRSYLRSGVEPRLYSSQVIYRYRKLALGLSAPYRDDVNRNIASLSQTFGL